MLCPFILTVLILNVSAKIIFRTQDQENRLDSMIESDPPSIKNEVEINGDPLWVLSISDADWFYPKLRLGDTEEVEDFYNYVAPSIQDSKNHQAGEARKDGGQKTKLSTTTHQPPQSNEQLKSEVIKLINKFSLSTDMEPDEYLTEYYDNPLIAIYFKGPHASLKLQYRNKTWHFAVKSSTIFPSWFHERHDTHNSPMQVPEDVIHNFYMSLLPLLKKLFNYPNFY